MLKKTILIAFTIFHLNLPVLISAKEVPLSVSKNNKTSAKRKLVSKKTGHNEVSSSDKSYNQLFLQEHYISSGLDGFEEIVTKVDSERVIPLYPTITISAGSYQNHLEAEDKVQRILQELLPLHIF